MRSSERWSIQTGWLDQVILIASLEWSANVDGAFDTFTDTRNEIMWKRTLQFAGIAGIALSASLGSNVAMASDNSCYEYRTVIRYENRVEPYTRRVTLYDHCGRAYVAEKVYLRTVTVPIKQIVRVYR